jgi:threonine/homoserine/homoserine lactone efflux protein
VNIDFNTVMLLLLALTNAGTAYLTYLAKRDIRKVEIATNSMQAALVASTAKASHAEGKEEQRLETAKGDSNV